MGRELWERYKRYLYVDQALTLDISRMKFGDQLFTEMEPAMQAAFAEMAALEAGAIANPDEKRMVGHYWLRDPGRAPTDEIRAAITGTIARVKAFAGAVHAGRVAGERAAFRRVLVIGIGGSALGPQLCAAALGGDSDRLRLSFFDNTDPDGFDQVLGDLDGALDETLTLVISKSGGTKETRNGMLEVAHRYREAGLSFPRHAVAVTGEGSELDRLARKQGWLDRFPMWDWVGGRTSQTSAVGLLPAALQGVVIDDLLAGARHVDGLTRIQVTRENPAALLALMWHFVGGGRGDKAMVVLPYKDRLLLMSRYLQQLVMESLGKEKDRKGNVVNQGISVYGNKGSTDQHAYVQQLREGRNDFFAVFVRTLLDRRTPSIVVGEGATSGDYLFGFHEGTRRALYENDRQSVTLTVPELDARALGGIIALFERAVGLYASLIDVNAYHQPGVEAGKKAATAVLMLQEQLVALLRSRRGEWLTAEEAAAALGAEEDVETVWKLLEHAVANAAHGVARHPGVNIFNARYRV
jgi:glucose-6-phosphate isomerase